MTVEWHGRIILKQVEMIAEFSEKASAERIEKDAISKCPVGEWERTGTGSKTWQARKPGSLRDSIKARKSDYKDGGYVVSVGNDYVFYASFVEMGVPAYGIKKRPFMRRAKKAEEKRFLKELKAKLT